MLLADLHQVPAAFRIEFIIEPAEPLAFCGGGLGERVAADLASIVGHRIHSVFLKSREIEFLRSLVSGRVFVAGRSGGVLLG
jgi:hypothetical protein